MEPLGAAAAAIQLAGTSIEIVKLISSICAHVKDAPSWIQARKDQISHLQGISLLIEESPILQTNLIQTLLESCSQISKELETVLAGLAVKPTAGALSRYWKAIGGVQKEKRIVALCDRIEEEKSAITLCIVSINSSQTAKIGNDVGRIVEQIPTAQEISLGISGLLKELGDMKSTTVNLRKELATVEEAVRKSTNPFAGQTPAQSDVGEYPDVNDTLRDLRDALKNLKIYATSSSDGDHTLEDAKPSVSASSMGLPMIHPNNPLRASLRHELSRCQWFIQSEIFEAWRASAKSNLLYISGRPGCGKTTLATQIIHELIETEAQDTSYPSDRRGIDKTSRDSGMITLFFFFSKGAGKQNNATTAIGTLIGQLLDHKPNLYSAFERWFNKNQKKGKIIWTWDMSWNLFLDLLTQVTDYTTIHVVLDALDECRDDSVDGIVHYLLSLVEDTGMQSHSYVSLRLIVTARRQDHVIDLISPRQYVEITIEDTKRDIEAFIRKSVKEVASRRSLDANIADAISKFLIDRAEGMFLWVELIVKELMVRDKPMTDKTIVSKLSLLPTTLASTYERILEEIPASRREEFWRIMRWLIYGRAKLKIAQLRELLCQELDLPHWHDFVGDVEFICRSFIRVEADSIFLIHQTARDFLVNYIDKKKTDLEHFGGIDMTSTSIEMHLAAVCIEVLVNGKSMSYIGLATQSGAWSNWRSDTARTLSTDPVFMYAAKHWAAHLSQILSPDSALSSLTLRLLDSPLHRDALIYLNYYFRFSAQKGCPTGPSPLHLACYFDLPWLTERYIDRKEDVNSVADADDTPLIWAAEMGSIDCAKKLLDAGADPNKVEYDGWSALHWAATKGFADLCHLLLEYGADREAEDSQGYTPLDWAISGDEAAAIKVLSKRL